METRKKIHFILNPVSGKGENVLNHKLIRTIFAEEEYDTVLKTSTQKKEAKQLAKESVKDGVDVVVACGGDGTINEVASALVDTPLALGILRFGSGNGLASNLNIPKKIQQALLVIKNHSTTKIDVGVINQHYFFSNASIGFGAQLIHHYSKTNRRQFRSYFFAFIKAIMNQYKLPEISITIDDYTDIITPFILFISNSNEMGYNLSLTPKASLQDGKLDFVYINDVGIWNKIILALLMVLNKISRSKLIHYQTFKKLEISNLHEPSFLIQIDGESEALSTKTVSIQIKEKALNVIVP